MAKNFGSAGSAKVLNNVAKAEKEKAQVVALQNIRNENLIDNPKNGEDITMTVDLEESMKQNGFTDPMEVTDFNMESGKYMILSGHRRRAAGVKVFGSDFAFPCVVRHFNSELEVQNYTLMANSQRDSAKDPCLFAIRYKMHEDFLIASGFKGSMREEIAKRLGISVQHADRYKTMNKVILPVWDMVRGELVGLSSVQPMATHTEAEQLEIYDIMQAALRKDVSLTRDTVKKIVDEYKKGKRTWEEIANLPRDSGVPLSGYTMNTEPGETREPSEGNRNDEVRRDYDPIAAEYDQMDADEARWAQEQAEDDYDDDEIIPDDDDGGSKKEKPELTEREKQVKLGEDIGKQLKKLDTSLNSTYRFEDVKSAELALANMKAVAGSLVEEMYHVAQEWGLAEDFSNALDVVMGTAEMYIKK